MGGKHWPWLDVEISVLLSWGVIGTVHIYVWFVIFVLCPGPPSLYPYMLVPCAPKVPGFGVVAWMNLLSFSLTLDKIHECDCTRFTPINLGFRFPLVCLMIPSWDNHQ